MQGTYPFAQKVLQSLEPQILKEPPTSDRRHYEETQQTNMQYTQEIGSPQKNVSMLSNFPYDRKECTQSHENAQRKRGKHDPALNEELFQMDTYYRELMMKERQAFERILQSRLNVAERDIERRLQKQIKGAEAKLNKAEGLEQRHSDSQHHAKRLMKEID